MKDLDSPFNNPTSMIIGKQEKRHPRKLTEDFVMQKEEIKTP